MVREAGLKGVRPTQIGFQTKFGTALRKALSHGDEILVPQKEPERAEYMVSDRKLEGAGMKRIDKQHVIDDIINRTHQFAGGNSALALLNANKSIFTEAEYEKIYMYIQDNSIAML